MPDRIEQQTMPYPWVQELISWTIASVAVFGLLWWLGGINNFAAFMLACSTTTVGLTFVEYRGWRKREKANVLR